MCSFLYACFCETVSTANVSVPKGQSVVFQGYLIYTNDYMTGHETKTFEFTFQRKECNWLIESGTQSRRLGYTESGFDGTNLYTFTYWNSESAEEMRLKTNQVYFATGQVKPALIPDFDGACSRQIWFALMPYSCGPMIDLRPCDLVTGPKVITNCNRILFPAFYETGSYVTNAVIWSQGNDVLDDGTVVPLAPPLDKGFTNLIFRSAMADWSDAGLEAPEHFEYHVFGPMGKTATLLWSLYGTVTNVSLVGEFNPLPKIIDHTHIVDIRARNLADGQIVHYIATNRWLQPGDPEFQNLIHIGAQEISLSKRRLLVRLLCLGFAAGSGLLLIYVAIKSRKVTTPGSTRLL
jgi:hypothetical protein